MALTRVQVEDILISRAGEMLATLGRDDVASGANADLNDPMAWALRQLGLSVAAATAITDGDLSAIDADDENQFLDLAEYRLLMTCRTIARRLVNSASGPRREDLSDLAKGLKDDLADMRESLQLQYGFGAGTLEGGVIITDSQTTFEDE